MKAEEMFKIKLIVLCVLIKNSSGNQNLFINNEIMKQSYPVYGLALKYETLKIDNNDLMPNKCQKELYYFRKAVDNRKLWALKVLDASGKPNPGFIYGNNYWLGSENQCNDVSNKEPFILHNDLMINNSKLRSINEEFPPFLFQFFIINFRHNNKLQYHVNLPNEDLITLGLCLPSSCTTKEIKNVFVQILNDKDLLFSKIFISDYKFENIKILRDLQSFWFLKNEYFFIGLVVISNLILVVIGTIYDLFLQWSKQRFKYDLQKMKNNYNVSLESGQQCHNKRARFSNLKQIIICFSIYSNTKLIFNTKLASDSIKPIHGMRSLGMFWIILIHTVFYSSDFLDNKAWSWRMAHGFIVQIVSNSTFSVDTFFFMSGFLVGYLYFNAHKNDNFNVKHHNFTNKIIEFFFIIFRRLLRLTPVYMMTLGIVYAISSSYEEISKFTLYEKTGENCYNYWWRNILFINNLFKRESMCMSWSWYLSNDIQFFIIAVFLLILSSIYFYVAASILLFLLFLSMLVTGYISYIHQYVPTLDQQYKMLDILYDPPWTRIGPHIIGVITSYIILTRSDKLKFRKQTIIFGWIIGCTCLLAILFGLYNKQISILYSAIYVSISRTVWAIGLAWVLIACCTKHGGIVNKILCFNCWIPLSRLTYCAYLLNPLIINLIYISYESAVHIGFYQIMVQALGYYLLTYMSSYILCVMVETPSILLLKILTK